MKIRLTILGADGAPNLTDRKSILIDGEGRPVIQLNPGNVEAFYNNNYVTLKHTNGESITSGGIEDFVNGNDEDNAFGTVDNLRVFISANFFKVANVSTGGSVGKVYKRLGLIGDSITAAHKQSGGGTISQGSQGHVNWANWLIGSPFHITQNLGVSGDVAASIFSRIYQLDPDLDVVFGLAGTNDVHNFNPVSTAQQVTDELNRLKSLFTSAATKLKAVGISFVIGTVPPNNDYTNPADARVSLLDQLNTFIKSLATGSLVYAVFDAFAATWDSSQPTLRVYKPNYTTDGTHFSNLAGLATGRLILPILKALYSISNTKSAKYDYHENPIGLLGQFREIGGVQSGLSGTGKIGSGWYGYSNGAGNPTLVWDNSLPFIPAADYVGPNSKLIGVDEKWQKVTISNAVAGSNARIQSYNTINSIYDIMPGDRLFAEVDVKIVNAIGVTNVKATVYAAFDSGAAPADQAYSLDKSFVSSATNTSSVAATDYAYKNNESFQAHLITEELRIPENIVKINGMLMYLDVTFAADGSAEVYWARPQIWRRVF